jgi:hypothetical protein
MKNISYRESPRDVRAKVAWALGFAELNLDTLRPGDRLNLLSDLHEFFDLHDALRLGVTANGLSLPESARPEQWEEIRSLQEKTRGLLGGLVQTRRQWGVPIPEILLREITVGPSLHPPLAKPDPAVDQSKAGLIFSAPWQDAFLLLLSLCLWQVNLDNLAACPECDKLFLRVRRQRYCSRACTNRANVREWRKKPGKREQEKHRTYERHEKRQASAEKHMRRGR